MQIDPMVEWQRLTAAYREKRDEELRELARDFSDLTETARQALQSEMRSRGMGEATAAAGATSRPSTRPATTHAPAASQPLPARSASDVPRSPFNPVDGLGGFFGSSPTIVPDQPGPDQAADGDEDDASGERDYTWKTVLCDCETTEEAQYLVTALNNAGLDAWAESPQEFGQRYARVIVAADQLEQARAIAAQPIPQEIVDESKEEIPEYETPKCPKCGAEDPVLDAVEPTNQWRCENCGADWSDPTETTGAGSQKAAQNWQ